MTTPTKRATDEGDVIVIDEYRPSFSRRCVNCQTMPVVEGFKANERVYAGELCGPCTFGTAKAANPRWWNLLD